MPAPPPRRYVAATAKPAQSDEFAESSSACSRTVSAVPGERGDGQDRIAALRHPRPALMLSVLFYDDSIPIAIGKPRLEMPPNSSKQPPSLKRFLWVAAAVSATVILVLVVAVNYAYGPDVRARAFFEANETVTDHPVGWAIFVVGSSLAGFFFLRRNERRKWFRASVVAVSCFLAGWTAVFVVSVLFLSPLAMYKAAKGDAEHAKKQLSAAEKRAVDAEARANAAEARASSGTATSDPNLVAARQAHLQSLRAVLRDEARQLEGSSNELANKGYRFAAVDINDLAKNEEFEWRRNVLMSDFGSHFPSYATQRAQLSKDLSNHDARVRELVERIRTAIRWPASVDDRRLQVAHALVHRCSRKGFGIRFERGSNGGYGYQYSTGGGGSSGGGPVPESVVAEWDAFRAFVPNASFESTCKELSARADNLARRLSDASRQASVLAEVTALEGDCQYLRPQ